MLAEPSIAGGDAVRAPLLDAVLLVSALALYEALGYAQVDEQLLLGRAL